METTDTVMSDNCKAGNHICHSVNCECLCHEIVYALMEDHHILEQDAILMAARAMKPVEAHIEISFKAGIEVGYKRGFYMKPKPQPVYENGKRDGIRQVVEWVISTSVNLQAYSHPVVCIGVDDWQAKLKEWGVTLDK